MKLVCIIFLTLQINKLILFMEFARRSFKVKLNWNILGLKKNAVCKVGRHETNPLHFFFVIISSDFMQ